MRKVNNLVGINTLTSFHGSCRYEEVNQYEEKAPYAKMAHPTPEHFFPLHVAMGAAGVNAKAKIIHDSWGGSCLSYTAFDFKTAI